MAEILRDVGKHVNPSGDGHYEATVQDDGTVTIRTVLDGTAETCTVKLNRQEWNRLASWVTWAQTVWREATPESKIDTAGTQG